jgi:hypothetical protein
MPSQPIPEEAPSRTTGAERTAYLAAFARSHLSAAAFCRQHGLVYGTFAAWRSAARAAQSTQKSRRAAASRFARVIVAEDDAPPAGGPVRFLLHAPTGDVEVIGADAATLVRLVRTVLRATPR